MNVRIDHEKLNEYRTEFVNSIPSDCVAWKVLEIAEYYLFTAAEDGWSDEEQNRMLFLAEHLCTVFETAFQLPVQIKQTYSVA